MHRGVVHDPGQSPGRIVFLPHDEEDKGFEWVYFFNAPPGNPERLPESTIVELKDDAEADPNTIYSLGDFKTKTKPGGPDWQEKWNGFSKSAKRTYAALLRF